MAQVTDYTVSNQTFPNTRADLNNIFAAIATNNSGTSAPSNQQAGQWWIDTTSSTWVLYIHDGTDDIQFATIDTSANTVNFTDSSLSIQSDPNPTLGADLDLNSNDITGTGNINITGTATVTGLTTTGNINFGDNDKANFGASNDLQIYHDGSNSYIQDAGTGNLILKATDLRIRANNNHNFIAAAQGGGVDIYNNNQIKLTTTSTGIDVTGTVVSDGLTVDTDTLYVDSANNRVGVGTGSPSTTLDVDGTVTATQFVGGGLNPYRNLIINGAMQVWQRGTSSTAVGSSNTYHADRFLAREDTDGGLTTERSTESPDNFKYSTKVTVTSADTSLGATQKAYFSQRLEGTVWDHLNFGTSAAQTVTLSFYVRSSLTGTFSGSLINDNNNRAYPWEYTINSADTWERKTITIPGDTTGTWDTGSGDWMELYWDLGLGSNFEGTAGAWAAAQNFGTSGSVKLIGTNSATWYITGVQLEVGTSASDFEFLPYDVNFQRCARYYQVSGNTTIDNDTIFGGYCFALNANELSFCSVLPYAMRTGGTCSITGTLHHRRDAGTVDITNVVATTSSSQSIQLAFEHTSSFVSGEAGYLRKEGTDPTTSLMEVDAEL